MLNTFFLENLAIYEIILQKFGAARVGHMRFACWRSKVTRAQAHRHRNV